MMKSNVAVQILVIVGVLFVLGVVALGVGWVARVIVGSVRDGAVTDPTLAPTVTAPSAQVSTATLPPTAALPTQTAMPDQGSPPPPTSTPRPTTAATPTPTQPAWILYRVQPRV